MLKKLIEIPPVPARDLERLAYSLAETAKVLGISRSSVRRLLNRKLLRASGALRHKVIGRSEIERFLSETVV